MTDEDLVRSLFETATADLRAPHVDIRRVRPVTRLPGDYPPPSRRSWRRRVVSTSVAAATGAMVALVAVFAWPAGPSAGAHHQGVGRLAGPPVPAAQAALYKLASTVRVLPTPAGRYAVQIEQQSEGSLGYLKATIIDSRTGDTWTYQKGPGIPAVLPVALAFSPTEAQLQASDPTDPVRLRAALIAQARGDGSASAPRQTANDLAVAQAIHTLWNPLLQPALRSALVEVIASSKGVVTDPHTMDSEGRKSIEITYDDFGLGLRMSVYVDPSNGAVLESSQLPFKSGADSSSAGHDVYLSQYWTDRSPSINPLSQWP